MRTVVGLFENLNDANHAYTALYNVGIKAEDMSAVTKQDSVRSLLGTTGNPSETKEGAGIGATVGTLVGLLTGLGAITVPGIGPILTVGALATVLGSTGIGAGVGAAGGGLIGALVDDGIEEKDARSYVRGVERGGILLAVRARDDKEAQIVKDVMKKAGAVDASTKFPA